MCYDKLPRTNMYVRARWVFFLIFVFVKQAPPPAPAVVVLTEPTVTVSDLADMMKVKGSEVLKHLMLDLGIMATITQSIDADTARKVADNFGVEVQTVVFCFSAVFFIKIKNIPKIRGHVFFRLVPNGCDAHISKVRYSLSSLKVRVFWDMDSNLCVVSV